MGTPKGWELRKRELWGSPAMTTQPIGKLYRDLILCRFLPFPLESFQAKEKEILTMLRDARALIINSSKTTRTREE